MEIQENIVNKVALSGLVSYDLSELYMSGDRVVFDIKDQLYHGLMLKEKDFREFIKQHNWDIYKDKFVSIICSTEAIVPTWAYMLLATKLSGVAKDFVFGDLEFLESKLYFNKIQDLDIEKFRDQRIVIKGCGEIYIPTSAFVALTARLTGVAKSIMYGEPCSTVPLYKRKD